MVSRQMLRPGRAPSRASGSLGVSKGAHAGGRRGGPLRLGSGKGSSSRLKSCQGLFCGAPLHVKVGGEKMSKSLKNYITIKVACLRGPHVADASGGCPERGGPPGPPGSLPILVRPL